MPHIDQPSTVHGPLTGAYLLVKALEDGVTITAIELSEGVRGTAMPERLEDGEVFVLFLDGRVQGYRIRGNAEIYSQFGTVKGSARTIVEGRR